MISESPSVRFSSDNLRFGATADDIVDIYLGEFSIGAPMRDGTNNLMRWWIGTIPIGPSHISQMETRG